MYVHVVCPCFQDWWLCVDFRTYFRKWSLIVHDWVNSYIYEDIKAVSCELCHADTYEDKGVKVPTLNVLGMVVSVTYWSCNVMPTRLCCPCVQLALVCTLHIGISDTVR